jgi:proline dehydrogenase
MPLMHPMRGLFLWMAGNETLHQRLPRMPGAQRAVRRFLPGERLEDALAAADRLQAEGFGVLLTHLGESLTDPEAAEAVAAHYLEVIDRTRGRPRPIEISIKPTQLGMGADDEACRARSEALAAAVDAAGTWLWLDMEGSALTSSTIELYRRLRDRHPRVGIALQAYLRRSAGDVHRLLPLEPAIRLVKGAYDEPASIAYRSGADVDASFQALALKVAEAAAAGRARLALGTHDTALIGRIGTMAEAVGVPRSALEVHMLFGIREAELRRLATEGYPCSSLVSYGDAWYRWYMRRLAERPANVVFALRQFLP